MRKNILNIIFLIGILTFIFIMSNMQGASSSKLSGEITNYISRSFNIKNKNLHYYVRKFAHVTEFFILFLCSLLCSKILMNSKLTQILSSYLFTLSIAFLDEFHQSFVSGRYSNIKDVIIDISLVSFITFLFSFTSIKKDYKNLTLSLALF